MSISLVLITAENIEAGRNLAHYLVQQHLAACVNLVPKIESIYLWEGELKQENEVLLIVKTTFSVLENLKKAIIEKHNYKVPEIIAISPIDVFEPYDTWVEQCVSSIFNKNKV